MKTAIGISLGASGQDFAFRTRFLGQNFHVRRVGANGSTTRAAKLLVHWEKRANAIGLGVVKDSYTVGSRSYVEDNTVALKNAVTCIPVSTGGRLSTRGCGS